MPDETLRPQISTKTVTKTVTVIRANNSVLRVSPNQSEDLQISAERAHAHDDEHDHGSDDDDSDDDDSNEDNVDDGDGTDNEHNEVVVGQNNANDASALGEHFRVHFGQVTNDHQHNGDISERQRHYMNHVVDVLQRMMSSQPGPNGNNLEQQITTVHTNE